MMTHNRLIPLRLPAEFNDLEGIVYTDLKAIVNGIAAHVASKTNVTPNQFNRLRTVLSNGMVETINTAISEYATERN